MNMRQTAIIGGQPQQQTGSAPVRVPPVKHQLMKPPSALQWFREPELKTQTPKLTVSFCTTVGRRAVVGTARKRRVAVLVDVADLRVAHGGLIATLR